MTEKLENFLRRVGVPNSVSIALMIICPWKRSKRINLTMINFRSAKKSRFFFSPVCVSKVIDDRLQEWGLCYSCGNRNQQAWLTFTICLSQMGTLDNYKNLLHYDAWDIIERIRPKEAWISITQDITIETFSASLVRVNLQY